VVPTVVTTSVVNRLERLKSLLPTVVTTSVVNCLERLTRKRLLQGNSMLC
jgi:hypothetical protein